jgi:hypothetical protein
MTTPAPRTVHTAHELDGLWIGSVGLTYDNLAWQANSTIDGGLLWTATILGQTREVTSEELISVNQGYPITVIHDIEAVQAA